MRDAKENAARPMMAMLSAAAGRRAFHMPGHKGRAPFGPADLYALDTTELPVTDDLYAAERGIREAEARYAEAAGAAETIFLHNGSTAGVHAMLQLYAEEGDTVLLPRNAHLSAINACVLGGLTPVWIPVTALPDGYCYVAEADVLAALTRHPEAKALLLTRPDYYGGCLPLERIAALARRLGVRLVVDEAHGAHFPWMQGMTSAGALGADAWVQSVHKTLPGLTGAAVLHLASAADRPRAMRALRREQTSSPSFLLMLSIDDARAWMAEEGAARLARTAAAADVLRQVLPIAGYEDAHSQWGQTGLMFDPTRVVLHAPQGGAALSAALAERGVDVEMHDTRRAVLILTAMDEPADVLRLIGDLRAIPPEGRLLPLRPALPPLPRQAMTPRRAAMGRTSLVPLREAAGRIAAAAAGLYPPGIPMVCPGEEITRETAEQLSAAGKQERFGVEGDQILCVNA